MRYWLYCQGQIEGPFLEGDLGRRPGFGPESLVCAEASSGSQPGDWRRAASVPALAGLLLSASSPSELSAAEVGAGGPPAAMLVGGNPSGLGAADAGFFWPDEPSLELGSEPEMLAELEGLWKEPASGEPASQSPLERRIFELEERLERYAGDQRSLQSKVDEKDALAAELLSKLEPLEKRARLAEAEKERAIEEMRGELSRLKEDLIRREAELRAVKFLQAPSSGAEAPPAPPEAAAARRPPSLELPDIDLTAYLAALEKSLGTGSLPPLPEPLARTAEPPVPPRPPVVLPSDPAAAAPAPLEPPAPPVVSQAAGCVPQASESAASEAAPILAAPVEAVAPETPVLAASTAPEAAAAQPAPVVEPAAPVSAADEAVFVDMALEPWAKAPRMEVLPVWLGPAEEEHAAPSSGPVPLWDQPPPPRRVAPAEEPAAAPAAEEPPLPQLALGASKEVPYLAPPEPEPAAPAAPGPVAPSLAVPSPAPAAPARPSGFVLEIEKTSTPMEAPAFTPAPPPPPVPVFEPVVQARPSAPAPAAPAPAFQPVPDLGAPAAPPVFQFKTPAPAPAAGPVAAAPPAKSAAAKPGGLPAQAPKRPSVTTAPRPGAKPPAKPAASDAKKNARLKLAVYGAALVFFGLGLALSVRVLQPRRARTMPRQEEPQTPFAQSRAPGAALPKASPMNPMNPMGGMPEEAGAGSPPAPAPAADQAGTSGAVFPAAASPQPRMPAGEAPAAAAPQGPGSGLPPMAEALRFAKSYDLGGGRGSLARWFGKSFLASAGDGMSEDWSATEITDGDYLVEYKVLRLAPDGTARKVKNYIFEVNLASRSLTGFNSAARSLLEGGLIPQRRDLTSEGRTQ